MTDEENRTAVTERKYKRSQSKEHYEKYTEIKGYIPTPCEMDLLDALLDVENRHMTATELSEKAGVSLMTYHRAFYKTEFRNYYNTLLKWNWSGKAQAMMQAIFDYGMNEKRCFADRKLFLELVGVSQDKKVIEFNKKSMNVDVSLTKLTTDEIRNFAIDLIKKNPKLIEDIQNEGLPDGELNAEDEAIEGEIIKDEMANDE